MLTLDRPILLSYIAFGLGLLISSPTVCLAGPLQKRLIHRLLDHYNTLERPVANESDSIKLSFGLSLMQILEVDAKRNLLVTHMWMNMEWYDISLRWDPSEYDDIRSIRVPLRRIWEPDVYLYNSVDEGYSVVYETKVVVKESGLCTHILPVIFKSSCKIDATWFPFDYQKCEMKFGSWTYDGFELDLKLNNEEGGDVSSLVNNSEWELLAMPGRRNELSYFCCPEPYVDVSFVIKMRRKPSCYLFTVIVPCVMMASMALLGFAVPSDSGEKLTLGITNFLSLTFFFIVMSGTMPATSDVIPFINVYLGCIMLMVASSVAITVLILNIHHHNADTTMSQWYRVLFLHWLPCILLMNRPCQDAHNADVHIESVETKDKQPNGSQHESTSHAICTAVEHELTLILKELRQITKQLCKEDAKRDIARDWKFAAKVLDRLCFIIFIVFTILVTIAAVQPAREPTE